MDAIFMNNIDKKFVARPRGWRSLISFTLAISPLELRQITSYLVPLANSMDLGMCSYIPDAAAICRRGGPGLWRHLSHCRRLRLSRHRARLCGTQGAAGLALQGGAGLSALQGRRGARLRHLVSRHLVSRLRPSSRLHLTEATIVEAPEATDAGATKAADVTPTTEATIVTW